jgi:hypothetical protein
MKVGPPEWGHDDDPRRPLCVVTRITADPMQRFDHAVVPRLMFDK